MKGQGHICHYVKNNDLVYKSWKNDWIIIKLMHRVDIDATLKVALGQGHKVKGQGHIYAYAKKKTTEKSI